MSPSTAFPLAEQPRSRSRAGPLVIMAVRLADACQIGCQDLRMPRRRLTAVKWLAVGCVAVGVWLLAIGILYTDWLAIALAIVAIVFGRAGVRR